MLFAGVDIPNGIEQIALLVFASNAKVTELAGRRVALASDLYSEIVRKLKCKRVAEEAVPEQFPLLRTIQHCCEYEAKLFGGKRLYSWGEYSFVR